MPRTASARRTLLTALLALVVACGTALAVTTANAYAAAPTLSKKSAIVHYKKTATLTVKNRGTKKVTWTSSNKAVVTVTKTTAASAKLTAKKAGKATIRAKVGSRTYKCTVTVPRTSKLATYKAATCTKAKMMRYYCGHCKKYFYYYSGSPVSSAHKWTKTKTVAPTCKAKGYTLYTCSYNKKHTVKKYYKDPVDHSYVDGACKWCGKADPGPLGGSTTTVTATATAITVNPGTYASAPAGTKVNVLMTTADNALKQDAKKYLSNDFDAVDKVAGTKVAQYTVGESKPAAFDRFDATGYDRAYNKFYLVTTDGILVKGPFYVTDAPCTTDQTAQDPTSKKGLFTAELKRATDLGCGVVMTNIEYDRAILPYGQVPSDDAIAFESNGKTFYFSAGYFDFFDRYIKNANDRGMSVGLTVLSKVDLSSCSPEIFYGAGTYGNANHVAVNTSNEIGRDCWIAFMEFLGQRYSGAEGSQGAIDAIVLGNEVDYSSCWNQVVANDQTISLEAYMEEYGRSLRLAQTALGKYRANMPVCMSLTHQWALSAVESGVPGLHAGGANYFAPKDMVDYLAKTSAAEGDFNWGLTPHCYGSSLANSELYGNDTIKAGTTGGRDWGMNGNMNTTGLITFSNLELLQSYLEQPALLHKGKVRPVWLNESGCSSLTNEVAHQKKQAAYLAVSYYKIAQLDCVKAFAYYRDIDVEQEAVNGMRTGLLNTDGSHKIAYDVYKYIDTNLSFEYTDELLPQIVYNDYVDGQRVKVTDIPTWAEALNPFHTSWNWPAVWDESKIKVRTVVKETYEVSADKTEYIEGEDILVTATGMTDKDWVGIYKKGEVPGQYLQAIYWNYFQNGTPWNIKTETAGDGSAYRSDWAAVKDLPAGEYTLILCKDDGYDIATTANITVKRDPTKPTGTLALSKSTYYPGEPVRVTATSEGATDWVGLYKKGETAGGGQDSAWWYYVNGTNLGIEHTSGYEYVMQHQLFNWTRMDMAALPAGEYVVYLLANDGYEVLASAEFTVEANDAIKTFTTNKDVYEAGEPLMITPTNTTRKDWVALFRESDTPADFAAGDPSLWYAYTAELNGTAFDLTDTEHGVYQGQGDPQKLTSGNWRVVLYLDDGYTISSERMIHVN
ncbi:MAG: DUF5722 domain-containing protein [Coriobacteriia bacterium]|nr:DUF5722 domain-containing protein [Coriobacteriia bacterium]